MSSTQTVIVRFHLDREQDRRAYELLQSKGKAEYHSRNDAIVAAVDGFFSRQERLGADPYLETREKEDAFLERIMSAVEQGVQAATLGASSECLKNSATALPAASSEMDESDESMDLDAALDFIDSL